MNVKISYTVSFEEIPTHVKGLLWEASLDFEQLKKKIENTFEPEKVEILDQLQTIDDVRKKMLLLDLQLADCYSILASYNKALADDRIPKNNAENSQEQDDKTDKAG